MDTLDTFDNKQSSGCYVHPVAFRDVGLVWSDQRRRAVSGSLTAVQNQSSPSAARATDHLIEEEQAQLRALGLPTSFGTTEIPLEASIDITNGKNTAAAAYGAAWDTSSPSQPTNLPSKDLWYESYDPSTGHYYYYCEAKQLTQWEPPKEGYVPMQPRADAWWLPPDMQQKCANSEGVVEMDTSSIDHRAVDDGGGTGQFVATEASPYKIAVSSYHESHASAVQDSDDDTMLDAAAVKPPFKARKESTGIMDKIPEPNPEQHIRFEDSSSESEEESIRSGEQAGEEQHQDAADLPPQEKTPNTPQKSRKHRKRRNRSGKRAQNASGALIPGHIYKYWLQRYSLFSRFDQGIRLDDEGWYSATPEVIAWHHAKRLMAAVGSSSKTCLAVDAFGGAGGNAIQLALAGFQVLVTELDREKAAILRHNAEVYHVQEKVDVICGDFLKIAPRIRADVVLLSPPWGGPEYSKQEEFDVENMGGMPALGLSRLLIMAFEDMGCKAAVAWLPRNSSLTQIRAAAALVPEKLGKGRCEVEMTTLNGVLKAMSVYYGLTAKSKGLNEL